MHARLLPLQTLFADRRILQLLFALCFASPATVRATWQSSPDALAWLDGTNVIWRFNYDPHDAKPFFHPLSVAGQAPLTTARPADHPWHYGLWFSWKYINGVNYWEQDPKTGAPEGKTAWSPPRIQTKADGSATIDMDLKYVHPTGRIDLREHRHVAVSAPATDGGYTLDWQADFTAGTEGAKLDRTPMPGEPHGAVNGGYAGLSLRLAAVPVVPSFLTEHGPLTKFVSSRARPNAAALAGNFRRGADFLGGVAVISDSKNPAPASAWYVVNNDPMRFFCAAVLAPQILTLPPDGKLQLKYRIIVRATPWTRALLAQAVKEFSPRE